MTEKPHNLFIHGRPGAHPLHKKYGDSIGAESRFVDYKLRWHDKETGRFKKYLSWFVCAVFLPRKRKYNIILSEGPHFMVGLLKWMKLIGKKQKTVALMDNETLYFIDSDYYSPRTKKSLIKLIHSYDGIVSAGKMEADLARKYASKKTIVKQIYNGIEDNRLQKLLAVRPSFTSTNIVFIGNVGSGWRSWYKGIDLLLESFEVAWMQNNALHLFIIGSYEDAYLKKLIDLHTFQSKKNIELVGYTKNLEDYLANAGLYVHPARGEAWGISVTEAMAAGVMPLVSNLTGSQEAVAKVDASYITEANKHIIADKIFSHFNQSPAEKEKLSATCKKVAGFYSETNAIAAFKTAIAEMEKEFTGGAKP